MSDVSISEKLAGHIGGISFDTLPTSTIEKVKLCILDQFGAHYAGFRITPCDAVRGYLSYMNDGPQATVWSTGGRTACTEAAFANSAIAHVTVFDDMHAKSAAHYGSMIIPAALALGEHLKCSGKELVTAIVCGYEAGIRVGSAIMSPFFAKSGFRPSGTFGAIGSAAAAGRLLRLTAGQMVNAIGLAANFGVGLMAWANDGTDDSMYHTALASRSGILSAILAKSGAGAPRHVFEVDNGFALVYAGNREAGLEIVSNLQGGYKVEEVYFKPVAACAFVQSAAQAALELAAKRDYSLEDIREIQGRVFRQGKHYPGLDHHGPFGGVMQAQMSNPFTIASIIAKGSISFEDFTKLDDPVVNALAAKVVLTDDEEAQSRYPAEQIVHLKVVLKDGSTRTASSNNPHFLTPQEVLAKTRLYLGQALNDSAAGQMIDTVQAVEALDDVNAITGIISQNRKNLYPFTEAASAN